MNYTYWPVTKVLPEAQDLSENSHFADSGLKPPKLVCTTQSMITNFRQPLGGSIIKLGRKEESFDLEESREVFANDKIRKFNR